MGVGSLHRPLVWVHGKPITLGRFLAQVRGLAAQLPSGRYVVNLCEDRYHFLLAFYACALRGQVSLYRLHVLREWLLRFMRLIQIVTVWVIESYLWRRCVIGTCPRSFRN